MKRKFILILTYVLFILCIWLSWVLVYPSESLSSSNRKSDQIKAESPNVKIPSEEQLHSFRSAEYIHVVVQPSYSSDLKTLDLPIEETIMQLIKYTDLDSAESFHGEGILTVRVDLEARARLSKYSGGKVLYTGAETWGLISIEKGDTASYKNEFRGIILPQQYLIASTKEGIERIRRYELPIGAPFEKTLEAPGSIVPTVIHMLGRIYGTNFLHPLLEDSKPSIHLSSIQELGDFSDPVTIEVLIQKLKDDDADIQCAAAISLGRIGNSQAIQPLTEVISSGDNRLRFEPAKALWLINDERAVDALFVLFRDQNIERIIRSSLLSLKYPTIEEPIRSLVSRVEKGDGDNQETASALLQSLVSNSLAELGEEEYEVRKAASKTLVIIGEKAVDPLVTALHNQTNSAQNRRRIKEIPSILASIGAPAVKPLTQVLADPESMLRDDAIRILSKIDDPRIIDPLIAVLDDPSLDKRDAVVALGEIGAPQAISPLLNLLEDPESPYRGSAGYALGKIGDPRAFDPLIAALKDKNWETRQTIVNALIRLNDPRAIGPLIEIVEDPYIYPIVCTALAKLTDENFGQNPSEWKKWWKKNWKKYIRDRKEKN